jgi:hypothetical protein
VPEFEGLEAEQPSCTQQPLTFDQLAEQLAAIYAHGPILREIRCGAGVIAYLKQQVPPSVASPWSMATSVPLVEDSSVEPGWIRQAYDDGTTRDVQVLRFEFRPEAAADYLKVDWPNVGEQYEFAMSYKAWRADIRNPFPPRPEENDD